MELNKINRNITFANFAPATSMERSISLSRLKQMTKVVDWAKIEAILMDYCEVGTSDEDADA